jgi:hypothetical protein
MSTGADRAVSAENADDGLKTTVHVETHEEDVRNLCFSLLTLCVCLLSCVFLSLCEYLSLIVSLCLPVSPCLPLSDRVSDDLVIAISIIQGVTTTTRVEETIGPTHYTKTTYKSIACALHQKLRSHTCSTDRQYMSA